MYNVESTKSFDKQCGRLHIDKDEEMAERIEETIDEIAKNPFRGKMKGGGKFENCYKRRIGDYRLVYLINKEKQTCYLIDIDHRKDVYK